MQHNLFTTMRSLKLAEGCKGTQVYALNTSAPPPPGNNGVGGSGEGGGVGDKLLQHLSDHLRVNPVRSKSSRTYPPPNQSNAVVSHDFLLPFGLPSTDLLEPQIEPCLKFVDLVEKMAEVSRRIENCPQSEKSGACLEQCAIFRGISDPKLCRRSLRSSRQHAVDVHAKVVLASWLRFERREDELIGTNSMDCCGRNLECPKATLVPGKSMVVISPVKLSGERVVINKSMRESLLKKGSWILNNFGGRWSVDIDGFGKSFEVRIVVKC